ncbi:MAG: hypothetical protein MZV49_03260 [Rhodopseudomonas palustris]|nr:hypothetical protein [Rhodopseudomonas palustris]
MRELFDTELNLDDTPMTARAARSRRCKTADVLVPTVTDRIDAAILLAGRPQAEADRQLRHRRRQHRPRDGACSAASPSPTRRAC